VTRVLVVDDDADIRETLAETLALEGYEAESAPNGLEALRRADAHRPDLILLDLMMPVMNGWEFLRARRTDPRVAGVPVVVFSASGSVAVSEANEADGFLDKLADVGAVLRTVRAHVAPTPRPGSTP
jgi:CheY-like chemotaxis protein